MPKLTKKEYCTGCTACASVCPKGCITMVAEENGFLFPVINMEHCVECGLCENTCPIIAPVKMAENEPKAFAAYSLDDIVRMESSSGGIFTEIAKAVLAEGGSVFGAAYNEWFDVAHVCVDSEVELAKLRGAKYAQSDLRGIFSEVKAQLDDGQLILFSGTPCQVGGLKSFLQKNYENLITVDFVCHGVPSPMAWREYVKYRAQQDNGGKLPKSINLRSKTTGWSRYQYSNLFQYDENINHSDRSSESLYMKLFVGNYISRPSCAQCHFKGYDRKSDLTIGDFWGIWDIEPEMDDNKGTSVVLVHTPSGEKLWREIEPKIKSKEVTLEQASQQNQSMVQPSKVNVNSKLVLSKIKGGEIEACEEFFKIQKPTIFARIKGKVKRMIARK